MPVTEGHVDPAADPVMADLLPRVLAELPALLDAAVGPVSRLDTRIGTALWEARAEALSVAETAVGHVLAEAAARLHDPMSHPDSALADRMRPLARHLGRDRRLRGEPLSPLLPAYRRGALLGWRRIAAFARQQQLSPAVLVKVREAVFRLAEDLSTATVDGYVHQRAAADQSWQR